MTIDIARRPLAAIAGMLGYAVAFAVYAVILVVAIATLGLIEIRQANLTNSNALIAMLEQRDHYGRQYLREAVKRVVADTDGYSALRQAALGCAGQPAAVEKDRKAATPVAGISPLALGESDATPQTCEELRTIADRHFVALLSLQDDLRLKQANLPKYYDEYTDGLRDKTPQLVPLLRYMDSPIAAVTDWARLPMELLEMLLLICMGALGGVISVTRCLVDPSTPNPAARDLCYRPVVGTVIALGIYVLFRAAQLFFGGGGEDATVSTSVFVLAALGLASGFCAREAVAQIERAAAKLLQGAEEASDKSGKTNAGRAASPVAGGAHAPPVASPAE
jgi:hypothetical protein